MVEELDQIMEGVAVVVTTADTTSLDGYMICDIFIS
jgi:hypothetical protein